jgi:hypothetical protein
MTLPREPRIHPVSIAALRPTQITVGMREVKAKRKSWHHLALALHQDGVKNIATTVVADLRRLPRDAFWVYLDEFLRADFLRRRLKRKFLDDDFSDALVRH